MDTAVSVPDAKDGLVVSRGIAADLGLVAILIDAVAIGIPTGVNVVPLGNVAFEFPFPGVLSAVFNVGRWLDRAMMRSNVSAAVHDPSVFGDSNIIVSSAASAQFRLPHFRTGQDFGGSMYVSISPRDLAVDKLVCLGQTLRKRHKLFFTSYEAAKRFSPPREGYPPQWPDWASQFHAILFF